MHLRTSSTCWENAYFTFRFPIYLLTIKATTRRKHEAKRWQRELNENWPFYLFYENFILTYSAEPRIACFHVAQRSSMPLSTRSLMRTCSSNKRITSGSRDYQEPSSILRSLLLLLLNPPSLFCQLSLLQGDQFLTQVWLTFRHGIRRQLGSHSFNSEGRGVTCII